MQTVAQPVGLLIESPGEDDANVSAFLQMLVGGYFRLEVHKADVEDSKCQPSSNAADSIIVAFLKFSDSTVSTAPYSSAL